MANNFSNDEYRMREMQRLVQQDRYRGEMVQDAYQGMGMGNLENSMSLPKAASQDEKEVKLDLLLLLEE